MSKPKEIERICQNCNKPFITYINTHSIFCKECKLKFKKEKLSKNRFLESPHVCENCGSLYDRDFRKYANKPSRFCSEECARSFSSKHFSNKKKQVICKNCGKIIEINNKSSGLNVLCNKCKENLKNQKKEDKYLQKYGERFLKSNGKELNCRFCNRLISIGNIEKHEKACKLNPNNEYKPHTRKRSECKEGYIYLITNTINNKKYIGKHVGKPEDSKNYMGSGIALKKAIKIYGKEKFNKTILEYIPNGSLDEREIFWIKEYDTFANGYNLTEGGDGGNTNKGKHWFTNGETNILTYEAPPDFVRKF